MKVKDIERDLLLKFYEIKCIDNTTLLKSLDQISVVDRDFTDVGVFTTFARHACLKIAEDEEDDKVPGPGALLNADKVDIGSLFHIDNGYVATIECYAFGDDSWPEEITCYEITKA